MVQLNKRLFDELLEDPALTELDSILRRFNIFRAAGLVKQELKHSNFLADLLDPSGNHGLGQTFLMHFLVEIARCKDTDDFSVSDVMLGDWKDLRVAREEGHIDILLSCKAQGFVCAIENKISSGEHGDQLSRYSKYLDAHWSHELYPHRFHILLSSDGWVPSCDLYLPIGYMSIVKCVERVLHNGQLSTDLRLVLEHYTEILRSEVMGHDELVRLCQRIYQKHRPAIDAIVEKGRSDLAGIILQHLRMLIEQNGSLHQLAFDSSMGRSIVRFADTTLDQKSWMRTSIGNWTGSRRVVLFEFTRKDDSLWLELVLGDAPEKTRSKIVASCSSAPFAGKKRIAAYHRLWREAILVPDDFEALSSGRLSLEDMQKKIDSYWERFLANKLPLLRSRLLEIN